MRVKLDLVHVEHILARKLHPGFSGDRSGFTGLGGKLRYRQLVPQYGPSGDDACLFGTDPFNTRMRSDWERTHRDDVFVASGEVLLKDVLVLGVCALILDLEHGIALVGSAVNWGVEFARWYIGRVVGEGAVWSEDQNTVEFDIDPDEVVDHPEPALMMASPGQDIFGHWILDYAPRLLLAQFMEESWADRYRFGHIPTWATPFLRAFGVAEAQALVLPQRRFTRFGTMAMPSGTKAGFRLGRPVHKAAWGQLNRFVRGLAVAPDEAAQLPGNARIYISRRSWGTRRTIANSDRLEALAVARGYTAVQPERLSLPAQARLFREARIVLGEDGSGLHNIIFSEPGCALGVVSVPDRINLWHMGICRTMGHRLSYVGANIAADGERTVDEAEFHAMLDRLESMASF
jgi:hypothetical protein